jgi:Na+/H+-translocating membrane pyrophosphatase
MGVFFCLILGIFGGVLVGMSKKDYSAYTERATATISNVVRKAGGGTTHHRTTTYRVYLDYEADGRTLTREPLQG